MADNFNTLYNRLMSRAPLVGPALAQQFINDAWQTLQSRRAWSWRRRSGTIAPPALYNTGTASSNVLTGNPTLITGVGTTWTAAMIGSQIRVYGLLTPYYTITAVLSATSLTIDQPWAGDDVTSQPYQILKIYYSFPDDFGYWYSIVSIKDGYQLWTDCTEADINLLDPQRTNQGQTYAIAFRDYTSQLGGIIGPVVPVAAVGSVPISTTSYGYTYVADATYIVQVVAGGASGVATWKWMRSGQTIFQPAQTSDSDPQDLADGVQVYWPVGTYTAGDLFIINAQSLVTQSGPRYELWPGPTYTGYLYPYIYIAREYEISPAQPSLPPFIANRGEVLLEMALEKCALWPGPDTDHPNPYFNLTLAKMHASKAEMLLWDLERNDEEVGVTNVTYQSYPFYPSPWEDGSYQQRHAPLFNN